LNDPAGHFLLWHTVSAFQLRPTAPPNLEVAKIVIP